MSAAGSCLGLASRSLVALEHADIGNRDLLRRAASA
jgi:hypothetical protein